MIAQPTLTWRSTQHAMLPFSQPRVLSSITSAALSNPPSAQSGQTRQSYTASGLSIPSGAGALYFKVVATVNGSLYESQEKVVTVSSVPDFLFVLYQLLASNLLYLALFILVLAGVVAFIPQRRAARARRAVARPATMYPSTYYVQAAPQPQPPPAQQPSPIAAAQYPPRVASPPSSAPAPASTPSVPIAPIAPGAKKRCPSCGTMVNADNMFCFFCGHPFR